MYFASSLWVLLCVVAIARTTPIPDPCISIASKKWVLPREVRACISAFPLDPLIKANVGLSLSRIYSTTESPKVIEVVNKTLAFHASVNYQIQAPPPFDIDVREDLVADLTRISQQNYPSDFDFHLDIYRSFKRANDGHCGVYNYCYDGMATHGS